jgi:hypothetical protein
MAKEVIHKLLLVAFSLAAGLAMIELAGRLLMQPSQIGSGSLLGRDLPPFRFIEADGMPAYDPEAWHGGLIVDGRRISHGDQHGIFRPDAQLGFTYQENAVSANGWWQSNNLGARSRYDVERAVPAGKSRILVFGESFAQGSRLPQEQAWPNMIEHHDAGLEVLNFAVDGYSMAQAFLRFQQIRARVDYDVVVLMFVPDADLWRDINTVRRLAEPRWPSPVVQPRFILDAGELVLVPPLYADPFEVYDRNSGSISPELHKHLLRYDRFYFPEEYELPPALGASVLYRLIGYATGKRRRMAVREAAMDRSGEAVSVSAAIFSSMKALAAADGARFVLAVLPVEFKWREAPHREEWQAMVASVCSQGMVCIDLLDTLRSISIEDYDFAHDNAHYGPRINALIAAAIRSVLMQAQSGQESRPVSEYSPVDQG